jgi:integrase
MGEFLDEWMEAMRPVLGENTRYLYGVNIEAHIRPRLGAVRLRDLQASKHLNPFYADLRKNGRRNGKGGLADRTVRIQHVILHRALSDAVRWDRLARNPADQANPPKGEAKKTEPWSPEQVRTFLAATAEDRLSGLWQLVAATGLRRSEMLGLRWQDVDLQAGEVRISQTLVTINHRLVFKEPKTETSRRALALDPQTTAALRRHRARQLEERLAWGADWIDTGLVFTREDGTAIHPERLSAWFAQSVAASGLPRTTPHGLRHAYVTMLLQGGQPTHVVSRRVGHRNGNVTQAIYAHVLPGDDEAVALAGAELLDAGAERGR